MKLRSRKFVSNSKYGNIYEVRQDDFPTKQKKSPKPSEWLWENNFKLWLYENRNNCIGEIGNKYHLLVANTTHKQARNSRNRILQSIEDNHKPNADLYAAFHSYRLERTRRGLAAVVIQRTFRGWRVRSIIKRLKKQALVNHGQDWLQFITYYRELVCRIAYRHNVLKPSCQIYLKQLATFMKQKKDYERLFQQVSIAGKLKKEDLMEYFHCCNLWPTQSLINQTFDSIFPVTDTPGNMQSSKNHLCKTLNQSEALEVVWTIYPPEASGLPHARSRWIRPIVDGTEAWSLLDDKIIGATKLRTSLRLVIQARLQRQGFIAVPSNVKNDAEYVTSESQALEIIEKFISDRKMFSTHNVHVAPVAVDLYSQ